MEGFIKVRLQMAETIYSVILLNKKCIKEIGFQYYPEYGCDFIYIKTYNNEIYDTLEDSTKSFELNTMLERI